MFRSLGNRNFRIWSAGAVVSNVGTWMQRIGQDWLVLTVLTHHNAAAVGFVTALQFGPQLVLVFWTGNAADRFDRRTLLFVTQALMGLLALGLGLLTISDLVRPWHVYLFALLLGCVTAFDVPARQAFVSDMVGEAHLSNAVALNSASFNASRLIGPSLAGLLISATGSGWVFITNGFSFIATVGSLACLRTGDLTPRERPTPKRGIGDGLRYVVKRPDLIVLLVMMMVFCTFGMNFPVLISAMAASTFRLGAAGYGLLSSAMAIGSVAGALLAARRERPTIALIATASAIFGLAFAAAAISPGPILFSLALIVVGAASQSVTTSSMSLTQMSTDPEMRGRVMALTLTAVLGGQPLGAPLVGWIANVAGPRYAIGVSALAGLIAAAIGFAFLHRTSRTTSPP